jgi:asparagine synthase (glutamine-hydrolysing)
VPRALAWRRRLGPLAQPLGATIRALSPRWGRGGSKRADLLSVPAQPGAIYAARRRIFSPDQLARLWPGIHGLALPAALTDPDLERIDPRDAVCRMESSFYMLNQLLRDSDVMGMAASLEIRVPFLDLDFARAAWNAGPEWRDCKQRFAQALGPLLDPGMLAQRKRGFTLPFESWMLGPLRATVERRLSALPPFLSGEAVRSIWTRFLARPSSVGWTRPWALFVLAGYLERTGLTLD